MRPNSWLQLQKLILLLLDNFPSVAFVFCVNDFWIIYMKKTLFCLLIRATLIHLHFPEVTASCCDLKQGQRLVTRLKYLLLISTCVILKDANNTKKYIIIYFYAQNHLHFPQNLLLQLKYQVSR